MIFPLHEIEHHVEHESHFGGKACQLGRAHSAGLPVPSGWALSVTAVDAVVEGKPDAVSRATEAFLSLNGPVAVRSSAVGEDGQNASFAGQHATVLNVRDVDALLDALRVVHGSARTESAFAYRKKLGLSLEPRIGAVVQTLVHADCAGILFTRNPMNGADERVIEAAWGLGEAVVAGLVTPDRYRVARGGRVLEKVAGEKDLAVMWAATGGTHEVEIEPERAQVLCLDDADLVALEHLAQKCESAFGGAQDLEWAFAGGRLYLTQRRAITRV